MNVLNADIHPLRQFHLVDKQTYLVTHSLTQTHTLEERVELNELKYIDLKYVLSNYSG